MLGFCTINIPMATMHLPVQVCGDHWINRDQIQNILTKAPVDSNFELDLQSEAPCLHRIGLVTLLEQLAIDPKRVRVTRWSNAITDVPYRVQNPCRVSYFFWRSKLYQHNLGIKEPQYEYAVFCGRRTWARCGIVYDAFRYLGARCLFSLMSTDVPLPWCRVSQGIDLESNEPWLDRDGQHWWQHCPLSSLDNSCVSDQYKEAGSDHSLNTSLLTHYDRFSIEIVMETYCKGNTFFPTEKTVRPLAAGKAMLIYGPKNFLARLQDLGFRTWHHCWDESYDQLEGPARWHAMLQIALQKNPIDAEVATYNKIHLDKIIDKYQPT